MARPGMWRPSRRWYSRLAWITTAWWVMPPPIASLVSPVMTPSPVVRVTIPLTAVTGMIVSMAKRAMIHCWAPPVTIPWMVVMATILCRVVTAMTLSMVRLATISWMVVPVMTPWMAAPVTIPTCSARALARTPSVPMTPRQASWMWCSWGPVLRRPM